MKKIDIGEVKETKRIKGDKEETIKLFTKKQRDLIKEAVEKRDPGDKIQDVLKEYNVKPAVYYFWIRNDKKNMIEKEDEIEFPNPIADFFDESRVFIPIEEFEMFYDSISLELKQFISRKYREWNIKKLVNEISSKITEENIEEVAKVGNITIEELKSFLSMENVNLPYFTVESIKSYLKLNVE